MKREKQKMTQKQNTLTKTGIVALLACVCCILWGSAIPVIKTGYRLMQVDSADTVSRIVFAGVRFTLAGILLWRIRYGLYCLHGMMFRRSQSSDLSIHCAA